MKKMSVQGLLVLLSLLFFANCRYDAGISKIDGNQISTEQLLQDIQQLVDTANVSGLAISILNEGQPVFMRAFGLANKNTNSPLQTNSVFYGASLSKAVFGYLVAQLAAEKTIDLDTPLQSFLNVPIPAIAYEKEWRNFANLKDDLRYEKLTARMCLSHTTGFPNWRWISITGEFTPEGQIQFLFDPGSRYSYSGEGINLLQTVIETITGEDLESLAQKRIFEPLGMNMTSYIWQDRFEGQFCVGHKKDQTPYAKDREDEAGAAGSMETTLEDYTAFFQHILSQYKNDAPEIDLLLTPNVQIKSKAQFGPDAWIDSDLNKDIGLNYGLGWGLFETPHGIAAFKEGHSEGFQHYTIVFPEKEIGLIMLSNSDNGESIFKDLLELTIGDTYTPWEWENYIPWNK